MKKTIILILSYLLVLNVYSTSKHFVLTGRIEGVFTGNAELSYWALSNNKWTNHKLMSSIKHGNFRFKGYINEPVESKLKINDIEETLYIEPSVMTLFLSKKQPEKLKLTGSYTHKEFEHIKLETETYDKLLNLNTKQWRAIEKQIDSLPKNDQKYKIFSNEKELILKQRDSIYKYLSDISLNVLQKYPNSYYPLLSRRCLVYISNGYVSVSSARIAFNKLSYKVKMSQQGLLFDKYLKTRENVEIGQIAPDFNSLDMNGNCIILSRFKGLNYVLLDFWASWCLPCIEGLPHIKELYTKYQHKGLHIIGISSDQSKENWISAINKYQISNWSQVMKIQDLEKYSQGYINEEDIDQKYPTDGIPKYLLIDKMGKIIGKWEGNSVENVKEMDMLFKKTFEN